MAPGPTAVTADTSGGALVGIIIDDLGYRLAEGERAIALPGNVSISFLPHTPHADRLARLAYERGHEVLLHLPMESIDGRPLGPGGLTRGMSHSEVTQTVHKALVSLPRVAGVSNHMGSLLTRDAERMRWVMQAIHRHRGLFFLDSRTTHESVAAKIARKEGVSHINRDIFLDNERKPDRIAQQIHRLLALAKLRGAAVGIGHPHPETLAVLESMLPTFEARGVRLVPVSRLVKPHRRHHPWRLSLSPSLKDVKSSKPSPSLTCCAEQESRL